MRLFLCGDVMTGRGIDQILPCPGDPALHERYVTSALDYVQLAERVSGPIERPVPFGYIWGDLLGELDRSAPDFRIANLETSITARGVPEPKGINYRMHPGNIGCLTAARLDACVLANNHVLDWETEGLLDTIGALEAARIPFAGAGREAMEAARPAVLRAPDGTRLVVLAYACGSSGVPPHWQAAHDRPGVNLLGDLGGKSVARVAADVAAWSTTGDLVMVSLHWGPNWGWNIPRQHRAFAHTLIEKACVDIVHGHSSHHPMAIEVHRGRPILYGCGDLINDYEGIGGHETFRPDHGIAYFLEIAAQVGLRRLELVPFRRRRFRLRRPEPEDLLWLRDALDRECRPLGVALREERGTLEVVQA
jgi:poly-gamma-glutamate capsule biosynthesis protein CapA/YwtB (metallophosphatase superfamily)